MAAPDPGLVARARALGTRLLPPARLEPLAEAADLEAFTRAFGRLGPQVEPAGDAATLADIEQAIARTAARDLGALWRWQEHSPGVLDLVAAHADRRSLRAVLRGAWQGAPLAGRLDGLLPTPTLPWRALADLARAATPRDVIARLAVWRHPDAARLRPLAAEGTPAPGALEARLLAGFVARARAAAAAGDAVQRAFVTRTVDAGNVLTALQLARDAAAAPADAFVPGGRWFPRAAFQDVAGARGRPAALAVARAALAGTPLDLVLPEVGGEASAVERAFFVATAAWLRREARRGPLGAAPVLRLLARVEAQARDLRALAWGAALGTPPALRRRQMVSPWA